MTHSNEEKRHSSEGRHYSEKSRRKRTVTAADDMLMAFFVTFGISSISFEQYMPESFVSLYRFVMLLCFALTWLYLSLRNGAAGKWGFLVFAGLFWFLPQLMIFLADSGPEFIRFSLTAYAMSEFSKLISSVPAQIIGAYTGTSYMASIVLILIACVFAYLAGMLLKKDDSAETKKR